MTHIRQLAPGRTEFDQVLGTRAAFHAVFIDDYGRSIARVDPVLLELCRLRMAKLLDSRLDASLRYRPATAAGLGEAKLGELADYPTSPLFSVRERVCLGFAEQFVIESSSITDADVAAVQTVLAPEEFIYFVKALSVIDQFQRTAAAFDIQPGTDVPAGMPEFSIH